MKQKPKFIISKEVALSQVKILKEIFDNVSYSYKTNPTIGNILIENNSTQFSIISINELQQFMQTKQAKKQKDINKKIWYFTIALDEEDLDILFNKYKIENFVVDNKKDLNILTNYIQKNNKKINLLLRMKLRENTIFTGKHYVFGMKVKEIQEYIPKLKANSHIKKLGIHFHRKTQNVSEWSLKQEVAHSLGEKYLKQIDIMNLGGGLPANYKNIHDKAMESIWIKIKELKDYIKEFNIEMFIEPGRFIAAPSVKLESNIIAINENTCFLNISIFNGTLDTVIANIKLIIEEEIETENRIDNKNSQRYILKGCTPDSSDILRYSVYLDNPKVGDKITFLNCGAYTYTTNFCALEKIKEEIIDNF
ncbi:MAG: decarboxylase [Nanoarchaeota archaeon]|nr:decarboxylase [Nanoarchaeota archaeon]